MAQLYLVKKLQGLFGAFNKATATESTEKFNVATEVTRLAGRRDRSFTLPARSAATAAGITWLYVPRTKKLVKTAKIVAQANLASHASNNCFIMLQKFDGTNVVNISTAVNTAATALTSGTVIALSLSSATLAAGTRLRLNDGATGTVNVPGFLVQIDEEEAK